MLDGKCAVVTGGARGVGKGVATAFVKAGARVLLVDRDEALGRETESELRAIGCNAVHFLPFDLAQHHRLMEIVAYADSLFGGLDVLANVAQAAVLAPIAELTRETMHLPFDTGFWPTFLLMQDAYPMLKKSRGCVVNFATGAAFDALPRQAAYVAAKEAIRALSRVAATEWGPDGIRVNVLCPFANSPGVEAWRRYAPEDYAAQLEKVPLRRIGDCETDIGAAAVFLASDAAQYITGQTLMVDGGQTKAF